MRKWQTADENKRVSGMIRKNLGIRTVSPYSKMVGTFTTHATRHTEPLLKHPTEELFSEFSTREIANIHGLSHEFIIDKRKTIGRQIIGQGVTDMFYEVAKRIIGSQFNSLYKCA